MRVGVFGDLEQRPEEVVEDLREAAHQFVAFVDVKQPGDLDQPAHVVGVDVVVDGPLGQLVPLCRGPAVDGQPQLQVLVLGLLEVVHDLLDELSEELAPDVVVGLHEHLAQPRLADGVVLGVELVEAVERVTVLDKQMGNVFMIVLGSIAF